MDSQDTYIIPFRGLKPGIHLFDFEIGDAFFEFFPESQIHTGNVRVHLDFEKEERMLVLLFRLTGSVQVPCDRCNEPVDISISGEERLIMKFGDEYQEQSEEVVIIPELTYEVNVAPFIYEYIHLLLPMRKVHGETGAEGSACDPAILRKLDELGHKPPSDDRWDALSKLKDNSNSNS